MRNARNLLHDAFSPFALPLVDRSLLPFPSLPIFAPHPVLIVEKTRHEIARTEWQRGSIQTSTRLSVSSDRKLQRNKASRQSKQQRLERSFKEKGSEFTVLFLFQVFRHSDLLNLCPLPRPRFCFPTGRGEEEAKSQSRPSLGGYGREGGRTGGETSGLSVLVDGVGDPVDSGVSSDGLVRGVDEDDLVVLQTRSWEDVIS